MANKIYSNHTLEEYKKKYRNRQYRLLKVTKKEVEDFDKKNPTNTKGYLLKDRKWWLIGDTYYEIPKAPRYTWFRNLNGAVQVGCCLLGAGAITTAIVVPTVIAVNKKNDSTSKREAGIAEGISHVKNCSINEVGDNYEITITCDDGYVVTGIDKITINGQVITDYKFENGKIIIKKDTISKLSGKIIISPKISVKKVISSIEVAKMPNKTKFYYKDKLDLTGLVVTATYDDGSKDDVTTVCELTGDIKKDHIFEINDLTGTKTLNLSYNGKQTQINIEAVKFNDYLKITKDEDNKYVVSPKSDDISMPENFVMPEKIKDENGIEQTINSIGKWNFGNRHEIINLDLSFCKINYLGDGAFQYCKNLKKIKLTDTINDLGNSGGYNFEGCASLEEVEFNCNIVSEDMFKECNNIKNIYITSEVANLDENKTDKTLFYSADNVFIPKGTTLSQDSYLYSIATKDEAHSTDKYDCYVVDKLQYVQIDSTETCYVGVKSDFKLHGDVIIPEKDPKSSRTVVQIGGGDGSCFYQQNFDSLKLPNAAKTIYGIIMCNIKKIELNDGLETIGECSLQFSIFNEINIPSSLESNKYSFSGCCVRNVYIDSEGYLNHINDDGDGNMLFHGLSSNTIFVNKDLNPSQESFVSKKYEIKSRGEKYNTWKIIDGVEKLKYDNFDENKHTCSLTEATNFCKEEVILPDKVSKDGVDYRVTSLGDSAFYFKGITKVTLGQNFKNISETAFAYDFCLEEIVLNNELETIDKMAFAGCFSLNSIKIPSTLKTLGASAFEMCTNLKNIYIDSSDIACSTDDNSKLFSNLGAKVKVLTSITTQTGFENSYIKNNSSKYTSVEGDYTVFTINNVK